MLEARAGFCDAVGMDTTELLLSFLLLAGAASPAPVVPALSSAADAALVETEAPPPEPRPAPGSGDVPIPEKIPSPPSEEVGPTVTIRTTESGDVVEEYRENGKLFMVKVNPVRGVPYYLYDDDRNGRLDRSDADRATVSPVYWTVYEWD